MFVVVCEQLTLLKALMKEQIWTTPLISLALELTAAGLKEDSEFRQTKSCILVFF